jgi:hypothetical protein
MKSILLITLLFSVQLMYSQQQKLQGFIKDSLENKSLENASVVLVNVKDSNLVSYTRAKTNGSFTLTKPLQNGKYLIMIAHPNYGEIVDTVNITESTTILDAFNVTPKRVLYEQVIVRAKIAPIRIKGDTVIYTADSFKVKDGANVEELLKKLPGIQVGRNGEIVAMGEKVKKILVDGEEFFGDDPGVAIKNLQADAVDKVEVFDKKSDQAAFTGIDDGVKDKTINLKLKDSNKNGYFGKLELGGGLPNNYSNQAMINVFKKKRKIAAFGIMSNSGNVNLNWDDQSKFGDDDGMETGASDGGGMWMSSSNDEFNNFWGGSNGIPQNWNGGFHFSDKFNGEKQSLNLGYKYNKVNSMVDARNFAKTFLPDTTWFSNNTENIFTSRNRNALNATLETMLDSSNTIKFTFKASQQKDFSNSFSTNKTYANAPINESERKVTNTSESQKINASLLWMHKFAKKGRTISWNIATALNNNKSDGNLLSYNSIFETGLLLSKDTLDQNRITNTENTNYNTRISYTEPLNKQIIAEITYALGINENVNDRKTFNKDINGKYATLMPKLSNNFIFKTNVQTPGLTFKYNKKKIKASIGTKLGFNQFTQKNVTNNNTQLYNFTNIFPSASFNLKMKGNKSFNINYNGSGTAPTLNQLQPIEDNTNPFYVKLGNPDLKQSFQHNIDASFNMWNVLTERNIWSYINVNIPRNDYTSFSTIDSFGRTKSKSVNVNGNYSINGTFNYGFKLKKLSTSIGLGPDFNFNKSIEYINYLQNTSENFSYGVRMQLNKWTEGKWGFWSQNTIKQNTNKASINQTSSTNFRSIDGNINVWYPITKKIDMGANADYEARQKDARFPANNNYFALSITISKKILKDKFTIQAEVKDILNQNRGFNRRFSSYNYTESYYNTLRRYWMLTITYNFNSQKAKAVK